MTDPERSTEYTPEEIAKLEKALELIEMLIQLPQYANAGVVAQVLLNVFIEIGRSNLAEVEQLLRGRDSSLHLLAMPVDFFGDQYKAYLPDISADLEHALWVCMNGQDEATATLSEHGITQVQNAANLENCGFLKPVMH